MTDRAPQRLTPTVRASDGAAQFDINEISQATGLTVRNLRAYLQMGVLHPAEKRGRSLWFDHSHLRRVQEVERLRERGYSLAAIADILSDDTAALPEDDLAVMDALVRRWRAEPDPSWTLDDLERLMPSADHPHLAEHLRTARDAIAALLAAPHGADSPTDVVAALLLVLGAELARSTDERPQRAST